MINGNTNIITTGELDKALKHAKTRKSPRLGNLPMELFKFGGNYLKVHIVELFNNIVDKNQNTTRVGNRNSNKYTQKEVKE
jgi:hypothetical protein